ncbi:ShlB/FhaC/HecB family hemolysin secretion/activation protein [Sulfurospirillum diekertiae]|uniref:Heme/hemopexin transporter protein HuxB n=1 Tax=Sulfurospirillum diekertiae TaxID=1854492 RepID=A0A1Y0HKQ4_9BACT|nr:ShlB/FhaC/HecB family hemolysin secretion/activation protein [Sulfurospirillum diekertiae]ARU48658.1 Heme/hemopexin transporter protein HuxB [Sulfurospirillum diekertiae]ASC93487.1 Heme/hemopexin transporter protein HuxB [Sulfurospirillum diekertiae]
MRTLKLKSIITLSLATSGLLFGAAPTIGDIEKQVQPLKEVDRGMNNAIPSIPTQELKPVMSDMGGKSVEIKGFKLTGALHVKLELLQELLKPYEGKSYTLGELEKITSLITQKYREEGYFVARAYIPKQSISEGILEIAVIEGNYGAFYLNNSSLVSDTQVQAMLDAIKGDNIVSTSTLERAMLIINDTPGVKVTGADVKPGAEVGTSDFDMTTEATNPYSAYIVGDNYGSKYTGRYRTNVGLSANSPLGYGDKLGINGVMSTTGDLKNGKAYYNFPLMSNGLRGEISASRTTYSLAEEYAALDALGHSTTLEASLIYPMIKSRQETFDISLGYAHKNMKDEVRSTDTVTKKESNAANLTLAYTRSCMLFGLESSTNASMTLTQGNLSFKDDAARALDQAGARTDGDYTKVSGSIEKAILFNPEYSLTTSLRFQKALGNKNLDGSEDFSLGGAYGVRAFPDSEHSAEDGYLLGAELFYALPSVEGVAHKASIFADTGYAKMENPVANSERRQLSDIGLGYQANYKQFFAKAQLARVVGGEKVTSESDHSTKLLLQIGYVY